MTETLRCSFCGKGKEPTRKFVAGPSVFICDECVSVSRKLIADDDAEERTLDLADYVSRYLVPSLVKSGLSLRSLDEWRASEAMRAIPLPTPSPGVEP